MAGSLSALLEKLAVLSLVQIELPAMVMLRQQNWHIQRRCVRQRKQRALLCRRAPISTLDPHAGGWQWHSQIEGASTDEVTHVFGVQVAPKGTDVRNPAFDVTPNRYMTAIITEKGIARAPYEKSRCATSCRNEVKTIKAEMRVLFAISPRSSAGCPPPGNLFEPATCAGLFARRSPSSPAL